MTAIAIFVKTPGLSPIKTRLAASIGKHRAEQWHRIASMAVADLARESAIGPVYFAVAESAALDHPLWNALPTLDQGSGGLGERMHRVHTELVEQHGSALLLGADAVHWQPDWLRQAQIWLSDREARQCIGRANDGGFWTYGSNQATALSDWTNIEYSRSSTANRFIDAMAHYGRWKALPRLTDLDSLPDVGTIVAEVHAQSAPTPSALATTRFLEELLLK